MSLHLGQKSSSMSLPLTNGLGLFSSSNNDDNNNRQQQSQKERRNDNIDDDDYDDMDEPIVLSENDNNVDDEVDDDDNVSVSSTHVNVNTDLDDTINLGTNNRIKNQSIKKKKRRNKTEKEIFESAIFYNAAEHIEDALHDLIDDSSTTSESFGTAGIVELEDSINGSHSNNHSHNTIRSVTAEEKKDDTTITNTNLNTNSYHHPWKNEVVSSPTTAALGTTTTTTSYVDINTSIGTIEDMDDDDLVLSAFGTPASGTIRHSRAVSASHTSNNNDSVEHHPWKSKKKKHDYRLSSSSRSQSYSNDTSSTAVGTTTDTGIASSSSSPPRRVRHAFSFPKDDNDQYYSNITNNNSSNDVVGVVETNDIDTSTDKAIDMPSKISEEAATAIPNTSTHSLGKITLSNMDEQEEQDNNDNHTGNDDNDDNNSNFESHESTMFKTPLTSMNSNPDTKMISSSSSPNSLDQEQVHGHEHEHDPSSTTESISSPSSPLSDTETVPVDDDGIILGKEETTAVTATTTETDNDKDNDKDETCSSTQDLTDISEIFHSVQPQPRQLQPQEQEQQKEEQQQQSLSEKDTAVDVVDSREIWRTELANRVTATKNEMMTATSEHEAVVNDENNDDNDNNDNEQLKLPKRTSDVEQEWQALIQDANAAVEDDDHDVAADVIVANGEKNNVDFGGDDDDDNSDNEEELSITSSQIQQSYSLKSSLSKSPSRSYNDIAICHSSSTCLSREDSYVRRIVKNVDEHGSPTPGIKKFIPSTAGEILITEGIVQTIKHDVETTWASVPRFDKTGNLLIEIDEGHVKTITDDLLLKTTSHTHIQHNNNNSRDVDTTGHVKIIVDDVERRVIETTESLEEMQHSMNHNNSSKSKLNYHHHHNRHPSVTSHDDDNTTLEDDDMNHNNVDVESITLQQQHQHYQQNEEEQTLVDSDVFETKYNHDDDNNNNIIDPTNDSTMIIKSNKNDTDIDIDTDDNNNNTLVLVPDNDITVPDLTLDILDKEITANYKQQDDDVDIVVDDNTTEETIPVSNQDPDLENTTSMNLSFGIDIDNNNALDQSDPNDSIDKKIPILNQDPNDNTTIPDPVDDPVDIAVPTINQDIDDTEVKLELDTVEDVTKESEISSIRPDPVTEPIQETTTDTTKELEITSMRRDPVTEPVQETITAVNQDSDNITLNPNPVEALSECTPQKQLINVDCATLTTTFANNDSDIADVPAQPVNASNSFSHTDCDEIVAGFGTGDSEDYKKQQQNSTPKMKNTDGNNTNSIIVSTTPESEDQSSSVMTIDRSNLPQIPADPLLVELKNYRRPAKLKTDSTIPDTVETACTPPNLPSKEVLLHTTPIPTVPTMTTYNVALAKDTPNSVVSRSVSFEDALSVKSDIGSMVSNLSYPTYSAGSYVQVITGTSGMNLVNSPRFISTTTGSSVGTPRSTGSKTRKHISDMIRRDLWSKDQPTVEAALIELAEHAGSAAQHRHTIARSGGILAIVRAMEQNDSNAGIQIAACHALEKLALETDNELAIGEVGGVDAVLAAMMQHSTDVYVQEAAWSALWNLTCGNACDEMTTDTEGGMHAIVACMKQHVSHPEIQRNACGALANLCVYNDRRLHALAEADGFVAIASALQTHWNNATLRIEASNALTTLLEKCLTVTALQQQQEQLRTTMTNGESDVSDDEDLIHHTIKE